MHSMKTNAGIMFVKIAILAWSLAVANAGDLGAVSYESYGEPAYTAGYAVSALAATSESTYRSTDNFNTVSTQSRTVTTPYLTSNKYFASLTEAAVAPIAQVAYPAHTEYVNAATRPVDSHTTYTAGPLSSASSVDTGYASQSALMAVRSASPVDTVYASQSAPMAIRSARPPSILGVAYSPAAAVSRTTYNSPIGVHYSW